MAVPDDDKLVAGISTKLQAVFAALERQENGQVEANGLIQTFKNSSDNAQLTLRILTHKAQAPEAKDALLALDAIELLARLSPPGPMHTELGKFRFINEIIKIISPKYFGTYTAVEVKKRCGEVLYLLTQLLPNEVKLQEAYNMLVSQKLVTPPIKQEKEEDNRPSVLDPDREKLLKLLLMSGSKQDLDRANALIQSTVKEQEKKADWQMELDLVKSHSKLLKEMVDQNFSERVISETNMDVMIQLSTVLRQHQNSLQKMAQGQLDAPSDQQFLDHILKTNDALVILLSRFETLKSRTTTAPKAPISLPSKMPRVSSVETDSSGGECPSEPHSPSHFKPVNLVDFDDIASPSSKSSSEVFIAPNSAYDLLEPFSNNDTPRRSLPRDISKINFIQSLDTFAKTDSASKEAESGTDVSMLSEILGSATLQENGDKNDLPPAKEPTNSQVDAMLQNLISRASSHNLHKESIAPARGSAAQTSSKKLSGLDQLDILGGFTGKEPISTARKNIPMSELSKATNNSSSSFSKPMEEIVPASSPVVEAKSSPSPSSTTPTRNGATEPVVSLELRIDPGEIVPLDVKSQTLLDNVDPGVSLKLFLCETPNELQGSTTPGYFYYAMLFALTSSVKRGLDGISLTFTIKIFDDGADDDCDIDLLKVLPSGELIEEEDDRQTPTSLPGASPLNPSPTLGTIVIARSTKNSGVAFSLGWKLDLCYGKPTQSCKLKGRTSKIALKDFSAL